MTSKVFKSYLSETLFAEGTLGSVVQAALQAVFTESVATWCCHRFIKQSVSYSEMLLSASCSDLLGYGISCVCGGGRVHASTFTSCRGSTPGHWRPAGL